MPKIGIDDVLDRIFPELAQPKEPPAWWPFRQSERAKRNEVASTLIARGHEPCDVATGHGVRKVLHATVTGGAPLVQDFTGDWRPGRYRDVDGKAVLFIDGEGA